MSSLAISVHRWVAAAAVAGLAAVGGVVTATAAGAAPSCSSGYVCTWTGLDGAGDKTASAYARNYSSRIASVFYNYSSVSASFYTGENGTGERITGYTTAERGFRNWSRGNHDRCHSHIDRLYA